MADLQFIEPQEYGQRRTLPPPSFLTRLVLRSGLVETERGAQYLLLGVTVVCIGIALFLTLSSGPSAPPPSPFSGPGIQ
jgi:hypothetical protein